MNDSEGYRERWRMNHCWLCTPIGCVLSDEEHTIGVKGGGGQERKWLARWKTQMQRRGEESPGGPVASLPQSLRKQCLFVTALNWHDGCNIYPRLFLVVCIVLECVRLLDAL